MTGRRSNSVASPQLTRGAEHERKPKALLVASAVYLAAGAFGILKVPGIELTYANAALLILMVCSISIGRFSDVRASFFLLGLMGLDMLFRAYQSKWAGIGYSANIGKLALFVLVAQQLRAAAPKERRLLAIVFGIAALCSEAFAIAYPAYREDLYSMQTAPVDGEDTVGVMGLLYRPTGLIGDPNYFAVPLVVMAMALYVGGRHIWFGLAALLVAITGSRSALLALFLPIVTSQLATARSRLPRFIVLLTFWILVVLVVVAANEVLRGDTSDSNRERAMLFAQGIRNLFSFTFLQSTYGEPLGLGIDGDPLVIHNTFLQTAATSFLLGGYLVYRSVAGLLQSRERLIVAAVIIEMMFLDVSSFSAIFFVFFVFSEGFGRKETEERSDDRTARGGNQNSVTRPNRGRGGKHHRGIPQGRLSRSTSP